MFSQLYAIRNSIIHWINIQVTDWLPHVQSEDMRTTVQDNRQLQIYYAYKTVGNYRYINNSRSTITQNWANQVYQRYNKTKNRTSNNFYKIIWTHTWKKNTYTIDCLTHLFFINLPITRVKRYDNSEARKVFVIVSFWASCYCMCCSFCCLFWDTYSTTIASCSIQIGTWNQIVIASYSCQD